MKILLVYATNSGSTFLVAEHIKQSLEKANHAVVIKQFKELQPTDFEGYDLYILGSPSWDYKKLEGQPHHDVMAFIEQHPDIDLKNKKFVFFGLGDRNYAYFCGATDVMLKYVIKNGGSLATAILRLDRFYYNEQDDAFHQVDQWLQTVI